MTPHPPYGMLSDHLLVLLAKQVVDGLDWIESNGRHFYEHGVPVAHRTVPKAGQFQWLEFLSVLRLGADESR